MQRQKHFVLLEESDMPSFRLERGQHKGIKAIVMILVAVSVLRVYLTPSLESVAALLGALVALLGTFVVRNDTDKAVGTIDYPTPGSMVGRTIKCSGSVSNLSRDQHLWLIVEVNEKLWPKEGSVQPQKDGSWVHTIFEDPPKEREGGLFSIALYVVNSEAHQRIQNWLDSGRSTHQYPPFKGISGSRRLARNDGIHVKVMTSPV